MRIRTEDGASFESESLGIWRVLPAASPLWLRGRAPRAAQPSGWIVVANRLGSSGDALVCLATCEHRADAHQLLDALLLARRRNAASFNLQALLWTRPCPEYVARPDFPQRALQVLGGDW